MMDNGGNLVPREWSGLALEYFGELPMIWGGVIYSPGMEFVLQHGFIAQGLAPFYAWITPELFSGWLHLLFWR